MAWGWRMREQISQNFYRDEFACPCGCGFDTVDTDLVSVLQSLRDWARKAVHVTSGCRCPAYNVVVGGRKNSWHMKARAADVVVDGKSPEEVREWFDKHYQNRYGLGTYEWGNHIDTRAGFWRG